MKTKIMLGIFFLIISFFLTDGQAQEKKVESLLETIMSSVRPILSVIWDNALAISLTFIFASALIGFFLKARAVDKCLKDFKGCQVILEAKDVLVQGKMFLYSTGMELEFQSPLKENFDRYSYIFYKHEFPHLRLVCRYQDQMDKKEQKRRENDIRRTHKPGLFRKLSRWVRNMLGTFRDAISQSLGVLLGHVKKFQPSFLLTGKEKEITSLGQEIIGYTGNVYDPILEKYIGRKVVVELVQGSQKQQHCGIFKEYSPEFLEILNIPICQRLNYDSLLQEKNQGTTVRLPLKLEMADKKMKLENVSLAPIYIQESTINNEPTKVGKILEPGGTFELDVPDVNFSVDVSIIRQVDFVVPRSCAVIRHAGDMEKTDWKNLITLDYELFSETFQEKKKKP